MSEKKNTKNKNNNKTKQNKKQNKNKRRPNWINFDILMMKLNERRARLLSRNFNVCHEFQQFADRNLQILLDYSRKREDRSTITYSPKPAP